MFDFEAKDYKNFVYGIVPRNTLAKEKKHTFSLWDEDLILFWNNGEVRCFKNACPHYGLSLSMGKLQDDQIHCGFHGWQFNLSDGSLENAPYAQKTPKCGLKSYKAFIKGGIIFVYPGEQEYFEKACEYILEDVLENPASTWIVYEAPFYFAMNSSIDYPHHAFHSMFYSLYGVYRSLFGRKNPLLTTYSPRILQETDFLFKFLIPENDVEITVHPFCSQYNDLLSSNKWQIFVSPMGKNKSRYLINIKSLSGNPLVRAMTYFFFHTIIRHSAMPEDNAWLKNCHQNLQNGAKPNLCDHDFGFKTYLKKFFIGSSKNT
jgi:nitrite reductase/ring-hydroxylating ferredoxin subunit